MSKGREITYNINKNGCHECTSHAPNSDGYPVKSHNGKTVKIYRFLYQEEYGRLPRDIVLLHTCDNRLCINIKKHLKPGSHQDNMADMVAKGRSARGERVGSSKLSKRKVKTIRNSKLTSKQLAEKYEVAISTINRVKNGTYWKYI